MFRPKVRGRATAVWWLDYGVRGVRHRESSETTSKADALRLMRQRIDAHEAGKIIGRPDRVRLAEYATDAEGTKRLVGGLRALSERQYDLGGRRSKDRLRQYWRHLEQFFGSDARAVDITGLRLDEYAVSRLGTGAARQTVNNELSALRRAFRLAIQKKLLAFAPTFSLPQTANARSGFFEEGEFAALLLELPGDVRDLVHFLRATGWRRDEVRLLQWSAVDFECGTVHLESARSKSGKPRVFPFGAAPELRSLLETRLASRDGLYVFHRDGQPLGVGAIRSAWARATKRAGVPGRLVHDLRRSAARDFRRAGVSESVVMKLCGWETRSMFERYNIVSEDDLTDGVARRFGAKGKQPANGEGVARQPDSVTSNAVGS